MHQIDARPFAYKLPENPPALVIIDMQKDFVEPGGFGESLGNDVSLLKKCVPVISEVLMIFRQLRLPVIHTREAHKPDLSDCPESKRMRGNPALKIGDMGPMGRLLVDGEVGNQIIDELLPISGEVEIAKPGKGAFYNTPLQKILDEKAITHLIFAGVTTEVCVQTTMREANDRGFESLVIEDGTESYFPHFKKTTIDMLVAQGGIIGSSAMSKDIIEALEEAYG